MIVVIYRNVRTRRKWKRRRRGEEGEIKALTTNVKENNAKITCKIMWMGQEQEEGREN